jgi:hypothetical protein
MVNLYPMESYIQSNTEEKTIHLPLGPLDEQIIQLAVDRYGVGVLRAQLKRQPFTIQTINTTK